jgi:flagellar hook-associated protein FlgK
MREQCLHSLTDEINSLCSDIAVYNGQITAAVAAGATAEEIDTLTAERDGLCSQLTSLSEDAVVSPQADRTATVLVAGETLVSGSTATEISCDSIIDLDGADDRYPTDNWGIRIWTRRALRAANCMRAC